MSGVSYDILSQFAKLVNKDKKTNVETTVYGTIVEDSNGNKYVKIDGTDQLTPYTTMPSVGSTEDENSVKNTTVAVDVDDRVSVSIKNHTATVTGNISSPAAKNSEVQEIKQFDILMADRVQAVEGIIKDLEVEDFEAAKAKIEELEASNATITGKLTAAEGKIENLEATKIDASIVDAQYANITGQLTAVNANISHLEAQKASVEDLKAVNANISHLEAVNATVTGKITAAEAEIDKLTADKADVKDLEAQNVEIDNLKAKKADIEDLNAVNAEIENLGATYANIEFGNITEAAIRKIFAESGIIKELVTGDAIITGELVGVTISGDLIKANTLMAEKLVVRGSDGNYYKLNTDFTALDGVEPVEEDSIHGSNIIAESITAEKVSVNDLVAFGATIGGFHITSNALYSGVKSTVGNTTQGIYLDSEGQLAVGDNKNFIKYFKDTDGTYKLVVSAGSIILSSSDKNVEDAINEKADRIEMEAAISVASDSIKSSVIESIEIGGRNLIQNSADLANEDYYFRSGVATTATKTESGGIVSITDMSSEDPGLEVSISGANPASVTVIACGKNLYNKAAYPLDIVGYPYSSTTATGTFAQSSSYKRTDFIPIAHLAGQTIVLSHCPNATNPGMCFYTRIPDISDKDDCKAACCGNTNKASMQVPADAAYMVFCVKNEDATANVQIELGANTTDYEAYVGQSVVANADGSVEGLTAVYPTMNIFSETAGVTVTVTYNRVAARSSYQGTTPTGGTDEIARILVEESQLPEAFVFPGVKSIGQTYTVSFWLKSDEAGSVTVNGNSLAASAAWEKYIVTFTADSTDLALEFGVAGTYHIYHLQLESGNKATDWIAAPEDVASDITHAHNAAAEAQNAANNNATNISVAESIIQQLADSIASLVRDGNGGSLLKQDSSGLWYFNIGEIEKNISDTADSVTRMQESVNGVNQAITILDLTAKDLASQVEYVRSYTDENGQPCLELGEGDSVFKVRITNTDIQFVEGTSVPAMLNRQMLVIEKSMVKNELQFGDDEEVDGVWIWKRRENGNLGLIWREV